MCIDCKIEFNNLFLYVYYQYVYAEVGGSLRLIVFSVLLHFITLFLLEY